MNDGKSNRVNTGEIENKLEKYRDYYERAVDILFELIRIDQSKEIGYKEDFNDVKKRYELLMDDSNEI